jgi:hypothetical protein
MKKTTLNILLTLSCIAAIVTFLILIITLNKFGIITGQATDTGEANLTIQEQASISFLVSQVNWGSGALIEGETDGLLNSEGGQENVTDFTNITEGLVIQNDGNVNVSLNISSSDNASTFIGGTNPDFEWKASNNETGSCVGGIQSGLTAYTNVPATLNQHVLVCNDLLYNNLNDTIRLDLQVRFTADALGTKGVLITATGTA